ncbi:MAG: hypothetical protein JWM85_3257, partial [Acidimicrobiaceae bacterium]|nr:hypothetical protein [Acidimicrobiaceae bacterium]
MTGSRRPAFSFTGAAGRAGRRLSLAQAVAGTSALAMAVVGLGWLGLSGSPNVAARPSLFSGSLVLADDRPPVVVDLATGLGTIRLAGVFSDVGAASYGQVQPVAVEGGTFLVNTTSGTFNYLDSDDLVVKSSGGGVALGSFPGSSLAHGFADGAQAFVVRYGATRSTISLVDRTTVLEGATTGRHKTPVVLDGFAATSSPVRRQVGSVAVARGELWALEGSPGASPLLVEYRPPRAGGGLIERSHGRVNRLAALEAFGSTSPSTTPQRSVAVATPSALELFTGSGRQATERGLSISGMGAVSQILPVSSAGGSAWFLYQTPTAWYVVGAEGSGHLVGTTRIDPTALSAGTALVEPAVGGTRLYTVGASGTASGRLLVVDPRSGALSAVPGVASYPVKSRIERPAYPATIVSAAGPRVVFDNPGALLAVVVFTDGSHAPTVVDASTLAAVDPAAPPGALASLTRAGHTPSHPDRQPVKNTTPAQSHPAPLQRQLPVQQVNEQLNCSKTNEVPHAPQLAPAIPSPRTLAISWTYPLLDSQDCEPSSYLVSVTPVGSGPAPSSSTVEVVGQTSVVFGGLVPSTSYRVVVRALLAKQSTPSAPELATTSATGPGAPVAVRTTFVAGSGWRVSWRPCSGPLCQVRPATWTVTGAIFGGGFVSSPASLIVPASASSALVPISS